MSEGVKGKSLISPVRVGFLLTILVVGLFVWMAARDRCDLMASGTLECRSNFAWFLDLSPNEVGDTLAGFAGALAFVWIVVTVAVQSQQLLAQKEELQLTRAELEEQRKATQDMARSLAAQAEIFEDERNSRRQSSAANLLRELIISSFDTSKKLYQPNWKYSEPTQSGGSNTGSERIVEPGAVNYFDEKSFILGASEPIQGKLHRIMGRIERGEITVLPIRDENWKTFLKQLVQMQELLPSLSPADAERVRRLGVSTAIEEIELLLNSKVWRDDNSGSF